MKLAEYLDKVKLRRYINLELVTARRHNTLPLTIYCYGRKAVFDQVWDDVTTKTRGLIVDDDDNIIARPYEKFFDITQSARYYPDIDWTNLDLFGEPTITEKVNGCLGIFWKYGVHWGIASKGSFHSPHAEFATKWMEKHIEENGKLIFPEGYTPVFEIICQEIQPHVIKYDTDGVILLDFINIQTGKEANGGIVSEYVFKNKLKMARQFTDISIKDALEDDSDIFEGYVATYNCLGTTPLKLKIKFPTFLKNRKIFYEELKKKSDPIAERKYHEIRQKAADIVLESMKFCTTQKEFAEFYNKPENAVYAQICFAMLNYDEDKEKQKRAIERVVEKL